MKQSKFDGGKGSLRFRAVPTKSNRYEPNSKSREWTKAESRFAADIAKLIICQANLFQFSFKTLPVLKVSIYLLAHPGM